MVRRKAPMMVHSCYRGEKRAAWNTNVKMCLSSRSAGLKCLAKAKPEHRDDLAEEGRPSSQNIHSICR